MIYNNVRSSKVDFNFNFNNLLLMTPFSNNFIYFVDLPLLSIYERKVIIR